MVYLDDILVIAQAAAAFIFLVRYTMLIKWWKMISGRMLAGMVAFLFMLTLSLTVAGSEEVLSKTPLAVTVSRLGFVAVLVYGIINLEYRAIKRRHPLQRLRSRQQNNIDAQQVNVKAQQNNINKQQVNVDAQQVNVDAQQSELDIQEQQHEDEDT